MEGITNIPGERRLWTLSFIFACTGNFLLFFAFYLLLPILPLYLIEVFAANRFTVGLLLSSYTLAALLLRPLSAFILDVFSRKPIYLIAYLCFVLCFAGYIYASLIAVFLLVRILHGAAFGLVTTAGNTLVVDIMPASRRGEGLGFFGVANNLAMAIGPMISLFLNEYYGFETLFYIAISSGLIGLLFASGIRHEKKIEKSRKAPISLDRFFLPRGIWAGITLSLMSIPYGMLTSYIAIYGKELGVSSGMGLFFSLMAAGMIFSRLFSGKLVDRGKLTQVILGGSFICLIAFMLLSSLSLVESKAGTGLLTMLLWGVALMLGTGYGMMFPAYNTLFINLASHNRRATASSTYLTTWDVGIGIGLILGGRIADTQGGLSQSFLLGAFSAMLSVVLFRALVQAHYEKHKLN